MEKKDSKPKKILLVIPTLAKGGTERVVSLLSLKLAEQGYEITIVIFGDCVEYKFGGKLVSLNIKQYKLRLLRKIVNTFVPVFKLRKVFLKEKPEKIVSFLNNIAPILTFYPMYVSIHTSYERLSFLDKIALKTIYHLRHIKYVIVPSLNLKKILEIHSNLDKIVLINNLIDFKEINNMLGENNNYKLSNYIVAVGRLDAVKRFDYLINAFAVSSLHDKVELIILGEGVERLYLEKLIEKHKLSNNIRLIGQVDNPFSYMLNARFLVLTSKTEVFPNVLIESMACGTPVISVDCDFGPREIIKNNYNGLLIPDNNIIALCSGMERLYSDVALYQNLKNHCIESAELFSSEVIIKKWEKLFIKND